MTEKELLELRENITELDRWIESTQETRKRLFDKLQNECDHAVVVEAYDRTDLFNSYKRTCAVCQVSESSRNDDAFPFSGFGELSGPAIRVSIDEYPRYRERFFPLNIVPNALVLVVEEESTEE